MRFAAVTTIALALTLGGSPFAHAQKDKTSAVPLSLNLSTIPGVTLNDSNAAAANSLALTKAISTPVVAANGAKSLPLDLRLSSTWPGRLFIDRPLRLSEGQRLRGDDPSTSWLSTVYSPWSIIEALPLSPVSGHAIGPEHYEDVGKVGDGSAKGAFGPRLQLRTRGDSFLAAIGSAASNGPARPGGWAAATHLTIESSLQLYDSTLKDGTLVSLSNGWPSIIWQVRTYSGRLMFAFTTGDGRLRWCLWNLPANVTGGPAALRYAIDLDLAGGKLLCVVNGTQTPLAYNGLGGDFPAGHLALARNVTAELTVGVDSLQTAQVSVGQIADFTTLGLRIGTAQVYKDVGDGHPAQRLDGKPINDAACYLEGADCLWLLRGEEWPAENTVLSGLIPCRPSNDFAVVLQPANASNDATVHGNTVKDIRLGGGILHGPIYDFTLSNVFIESSQDGVCSAFPTATYPTLIERCRIGAKRFPVNLNMQMQVSIRDSHISESGSSCIMLRDCGMIGITNLFVEGIGPIERAIDISASSDSQLIALDNVALDFEGTGTPTDTLLRVVANSGQNGSRLSVRNLYCGTVPPSVKSLVRLESRMGTSGAVAPAVYDLRNVMTAFGSVPTVIASGQWVAGGAVQVQPVGPTPTPVMLGAPPMQAVPGVGGRTFGRRRAG